MDSLPADLERIEDLRQRDPEKALGLAETAVTRASRDSDRRKLAQALCVLGGVQRTLGRWDDAETAYYFAGEIMVSAGEIRDWFLWNVRVTYLWIDQRRFDEARESAERALRISRKLPELLWQGWALANRAVVAWGEKESGAEDYARQALQALNPGDIGYRIAVETLITILCESDDSDLEEIYYLLKKERPDSLVGSYGASKRRWLEALVHRRAGHFEDAETCFRDAYRSLAALGVGTDAALCCLDLALLYLENGRPRDANRLSGELFPVFHLLRLNREATAALMIFRRAAEQDRLTVELVRDVKARLEAIPAPPFIPRET